MKALQLVTLMNGQMIPTYAGLLTLGRQERIRELMPTAEAGFQMLRGTDVTVNESFYLPLLADALKRIGLAERTGRGVDRIYEGFLRFGRDLPDYSASTSVSVRHCYRLIAADIHQYERTASQCREISQSIESACSAGLQALFCVYLPY